VTLRVSPPVMNGPAATTDEDMRFGPGSRG
jgi:hypothetical protein